MKKIFLLLIATALHFVGLNAQTPCPNLVKNGDFEAGNDGSFTSGLSPNCACTSATYCVSTGFNLKCSGWPANFADHTPTGVGNYLLIDGSGLSLVDVWSTTVTVVPGDAYTFSFWVASVYPTSQQTIDLGMMVNGVNVKPITFTQVTPSWTNYTFSGVCPAGVTNLPIAIRQINGGGFNDFGIDDVSFTACKTPAFFACDSVVVTCDAASPNDFVAAILNVGNVAAQFDNTQWATAAVNARHSVNTSFNTQFTRTNLGQVFGICYKPNGDIFVASTSIYGIDAWGSNSAINQKPTPAGSTPNSGSIYRIDGTSIVEFAELPNRGQGLGNLCYDALHNLIFVTNFFDGFIYSVDGTTGAYTSFDPNFNGFSGTSYATVPVYAPLGQRPWGIASFGTTVNNVVLYYSRWSADGSNQGTGQRNEIWAVPLNTAGAPINLTGTLIYTMPLYSSFTYSNPVADIEISRSGTRMLLAERSMHGSSSWAHESRLIELTGAGLLWSNQPLSKFNVGGGLQANCTGGADYGDLDLNQPLTKTCDSSVWTMSDFMTGVTGFGAAYGVQVLKPTGGNQLNSKIIDLNNAPGTQDKTHIGDVDYFRCLDCQPQTGQSCDFYRPGAVDSVCCRATLNASQLTGVPAITSIGYVVTGGVIQGFTSSCIVANPNSYSGTTSGTVTFTGACTNMQFITAALNSTSATGNITVTWTVNFANGTSCTYQSFVKNCPHPVQLCDSFAIKQCICTGAALSYIDIKITNLMIPNSPICSVKVQYFNIFGILTSGYWTYGAVTAPFNTVAFDPTISFIPAVANSLSVNTNATINPQMFFPNPFNVSFSGSIVVTAFHCNGDSCVKSWKPTPQPIGQISDVEVAKAKTPYSKYYVAAFKVKSKTGVNTDNLQFKYFTIGIKESAQGAVKPEIIAVTGAQMYKEREGNSVSLALASAAHGRENALFELNNDYTTRDSAQFVHVIFGGALPRTLLTTFYEANGSVIGTDSIKIDSTITGTAEQLRGNAPSLFLVSGAPNPAKEVFNAKVIVNEMRDIQVDVYDITGSLVGHQSVGKLPIGTHEIAVPTQHLPNGTYIVKIKSTEDPVGVSIKMVILH